MFFKTDYSELYSESQNSIIFLMLVGKSSEDTLAFLFFFPSTMDSKVAIDLDKSTCSFIQTHCWYPSNKRH